MEAHADAAARDKKSPGKAWKILVIDDEPGIREVIGEFIRMDGFEPYLAATGHEAMVACRGTDFDVILSDIILPDTNGIELLETLRTLEPEAIQILITGMPTIETATTAIRRGIHDYLCKPVSRAAISRTIGNAIKLKELADNNARLASDNERYRNWLENMVRQKTERLQISLRQLTDLRTALDQTQILVVTDNRNRIRYANRRFSEITGIPAERLIGRDYLGVVCRPDDDRLIGTIQETLNDKRIWRGTLQNRDRAGKRYWLDTAIVPFTGKDGKQYQYIAIHSDVSALIESREEISRLAFSDPLTRLPNRTRFCQTVAEEIAHAEGLGSFGIAILDLDNFKVFNEAYGRPTGDAVIMKFVDRILEASTAKTLARLGSDQFCILLPAPSDEKTAIQFAGLLLPLFGRPYKIGEHCHHVTACIGIALYPQHGNSAEELLQNASLALDMAKSEGHGNFSMYRSRMHQLSLSRISLGNDLRHALEEDQFRLYYQPKISTTTGKLVGAEALLRWFKPGVGIVPPSEFISYAEESGLIIKIGHWVLNEACRQIREWQDKGMPEMIVSVNVSARQFKHPNILTYVIGALTRNRLAAESLELEITENVLMNGIEATLETLNSLHDLGIGLSIDDFGTGYSSLAYLKDFPIQVLKIDRSFISNIGIDERDTSITRGIISLAHNLNLKVLAEGVETVEQLEFLKVEGCHEIQGYYYSPPLLASEFEAKYINE